MSYQYSAFILFPSKSDVSLEQAEHKLRVFFEDEDKSAEISFPTGRIVRKKQNHLLLIVEKWSLRIHFNSEPYVLEESKELAEYYAAERPDKEVIASCASRLEIISDLDPNGDYFNYYVFVVELLDQFSGAITFDCQVQDFV
ncbi:MAG: hypothetical protein ACPGWR_30490 [Ardenticatenaceae bacterium]